MSDRPPIKIPRVGQPAARSRTAPYALGLGVLGTAVFAGLASNRAAREEQSSALPPLRATTMTAPAPPPPFAVPIAAPTVVIPMTSVPQPAPPIALVPRERPVYFGPAPVARPVRPVNDSAERARARATAPTLIVDLGPTKSSDLSVSLEPLGPAILPAAAFFRPASLQTADPVGASIAAAGPPAEAVTVVAPVVGSVDSLNSRDLNANERFSARAGSRETEVARAQRLPNQDLLVTQGTIIGAVMETALNSDVPGLARAIVSRDVLSFDGSQVLIPAGSRVIGEYNSGVAQGASRIFIVWNRLIRPDGVSVSLASPAVDDLGRGGLSGSVNRHLLQRYGAPILLSILTGGISAIAQSRSNGSTVVVNSSNEATSLAGQATRGTDIPPTITTRQGALVRIFVARDLDFAPVGPIR